MPVFLSNLEKLLVANKGGDGHFVGDEVSVGHTLSKQYIYMGV